MKPNDVKIEGIVLSLCKYHDLYGGQLILRNWKAETTKSKDEANMSRLYPVLTLPSNLLRSFQRISSLHTPIIQSESMDIVRAMTSD